MKATKIIPLLAALVCAAFPAPAVPPGYGVYGFTPLDPDPGILSAYGTGMNNYIEAAVCLDPSDDPMLQAMKGGKVVGVRCYLREDYHQKSKSYSAVKAYSGGLDEPCAVKTVNFDKGWNEVYFDEPIEIAGDPVYVSTQVFETKGSPYPLVSYGPSSTEGGFFINMNREGWEDFSARGGVLVQAIVESSADRMSGHAFASPSGIPLSVGSGADFECSLYVHNQSAEPCSSVEVETVADNGESVHTYTYEFSEPVAPYDGVCMPVTLAAPETIGTDVKMGLRVIGVNGSEAAPSRTVTAGLYVSEDVFRRIPLIEEFTGLTCTNCPFMFYYLDMAIEKQDFPILYVAHHAGFNNDRLTQPVDEALLYLFPDGRTFNPAVMYDRRPIGTEPSPINGAKLASDEPYISAIEEIMGYPAQAEVFVETREDSDKTGCRVYGRVGHAMAESGVDLYLSAYLVEDEISTDDYFQYGINDGVAQGAPDDLAERFRHNGVIRISYADELLGDRLVPDRDGSFSVDFDAQAFSPGWKRENCHIVAFVHKIDKDDLTQNFVLNAGDSRLTGSKADYVCDDHAVNVRADRDGRITTSTPVSSLCVYDMAGRRYGNSVPLSPGLYIVTYTLPSGRKGVSRITIM